MVIYRGRINISGNPPFNVYIRKRKITAPTKVDFHFKAFVD